MAHVRFQAARSRRAQAGLILLGAGIVASVVAGYLFFGRQKPRPAATTGEELVHTVARSDFRMEVVERGEVESSGSAEVRCEVEARNSNKGGITILKIVPEGTHVKPGDFLVKLDSSSLEIELTQQRIALTTSEALMVQAQHAYETALISKQEYLEGTFEQERQLIQSEMFVSEENLRRAKEYLGYSKRLAKHGYVTSLQLEADQFAVEKANNELATARTKLRVLEKFSQAKKLKELESQIVSTKAQWQAEQERVALERKELQEIETLLAKCEILAPKAGQVKFAHRREFRGDNNFIVEEGALLREGQVIIRLPDSAEMKVKVTVNESVIDRVREGMPCSIRRVGNRDVVYPGRITQVNQYSEPPSWRMANVKSYAAEIAVDNTDGQLREGMTAEVTVHSQALRNELQVPVQALHGHGEAYYCLVRNDRQWQAAKVELGPSNDQFAVIRSGLAEGAVVSLNPRNHLADAGLPPLSAAERQQAIPPGPRMKGEEVAARGNQKKSLVISH